MPKKKKPLVPLLPEVMDFHLDDDDRLEKKIQSDIMKYLKNLHCSNFAKIQQGPMSKNGVSDIIGCCHGLSVVMEVKIKTGNPTALQAIYLNDNVRARGYSAVVRSVADAKGVIRRIEERICST